TLAGLGKFDDALGDDFVGEIAAVGKPKGYASHFECDAHDALGLKVEFGAVQEWGNRHGRPSLCRRKRDGLSATGAYWSRCRGGGILRRDSRGASVRLPTYRTSPPQSRLFAEPKAWEQRFSGGQHCGAWNA